MNLHLNSNEEIIEKCDLKDREDIINILNEYESFKREVERQVNDASLDYIEITCKGHVNNKVTIMSFWNKDLKIAKNQIRKIEYFKGYCEAVRIELEFEVYFINDLVDDTKLIKYTHDVIDKTSKH